MIQHFFRRLALGLFCIYLALLPGSTITIMIDRVPVWGASMGGALLLLQGALLLCWLVGNYGRRGAIVALLVFLAAWLVEHIGVTTGAPFGRYRYTGTLQPQLLGVVPLAIPCAWLAVALGAWQLALRRRRPSLPALLVTATLIVLLDLQIETVAAVINRYWVWIDGGSYYGVPLSNFAAWWCVGALIALMVARGLRAPLEPLGDARLWGTAARVQTALPSYLYLSSVLMFTAINLARGYAIAGAIGLALLLALTLSARSERRAPAAARATHQIAD